MRAERSARVEAGGRLKVYGVERCVMVTEISSPEDWVAGDARGGEGEGMAFWS